MQPRFSLVLLIVAAAALAEAGPPQGLDEVAKADAQINDLTFVDRRHGFAVGDRGVILRTEDGGRRWNQLESPVDCPLYSVAFVDHLRGWAVGGFTKPYLHTPAAVVLKTEDGGSTWRRLPADSVPILKRVRFFDERRGIAVGVGTDFAPGGVFETRDGGRRWQPLPTERLSSWLAADFLAPGVGVLAGERGALATAQNGVYEPSETLTGDRRSLRDLQLVEPHGGWVVGDGGLVLRTRDAGQSWRPPAATPLGKVGAACDWRAVAAIGPRVWIAGAPGATIVHSTDGGESWQTQATGVTAPLSAIHFIDDRHGWAAGALGTILATDDGGQTWRAQRRGGARAAVLVVTPTSAEAPLEFIASLAAGEGYLTAVEAAFRSPAQAATASESTRLREATLASGAALSHVGWRLSVDADASRLPIEVVRGQLNQQAGGAADASLQRRLVARFRALRPDVVVLTRRAADQPTGVEQLLERVVHLAAAAAADPQSNAELRELGLTPHRLRRIAVVSPTADRPRSRLSTGDFDAQLGTSPAQWVGVARGLLNDTFVAPPEAFGWRTVFDAAVTSSADSLVAGLESERGSDARRPAARPNVSRLAALRGLSQKRREMKELLKHDKTSEAWRGQLVSLTSGLDADNGAALLDQLADSYQTAGKLDMAADTRYLLARRYADHPLTEPALVWVLRYYASAEVAHAEQTADRGQPPGPLANVATGRPPAALAAASSTGPLTPEERLERTTALATYLEEARPTLYAAPSVRFPIAAALRGRGWDDQAEQSLGVLAQRAIAGDWRRAAEREVELAKTGAPPQRSPSVLCQVTPSRPTLDGLFSEVCWVTAAPVALPGGAKVRFARDGEFLLIALRCPKRPGLDYQEHAGRRPRDGDLQDQDRVTLRLDTDRDYTTAWELTIDSRGWTNDRCWGDRHWDPSWFVAARQTPEEWTAEAAIPLAALTAEPPTAGQAWGLACDRHAPGAPSESWTGESSRRSPARFGLLRFE